MVENTPSTKVDILRIQHPDKVGLRRLGYLLDPIAQRILRIQHPDKVGLRRNDHIPPDIYLLLRIQHPDKVGLRLKSGFNFK